MIPKVEHDTSISDIAIFQTRSSSVKPSTSPSSNCLPILSWWVWSFEASPFSFAINLRCPKIFLCDSMMFVDDILNEHWHLQKRQLKTDENQRSKLGNRFWISVRSIPDSTYLPCRSIILEMRLLRQVLGKWIFQEYGMCCFESCAAVWYPRQIKLYHKDSRKDIVPRVYPNNSTTDMLLNIQIILWHACTLLGLQHY